MIAFEGPEYTGTRIQSVCDSGGVAGLQRAANSPGALLGMQAKTPSSQARLIESVGGDVELLKRTRAAHESFVTSLIGTVAGGGIGLGSAKGLAAVGKDTVRAGFFQGTRLHPRVMAQLKSGDMHAFPNAVDGFAARNGTVRSILDSRGNPVEMLTVRGSYRGKDGTFEYIKNQSGEIYHRFFKVD